VTAQQESDSEARIACCSGGHKDEDGHWRREGWHPSRGSARGRSPKQATCVSLLSLPPITIHTANLCNGPGTEQGRWIPEEDTPYRDTLYSVYPGSTPGIRVAKNFLALSASHAFRFSGTVASGIPGAVCFRDSRSEYPREPQCC
jgi:hypothetical protein